MEEALLIALLNLWHSPAQPCMERNRDRIVTAVTEAEHQRVRAYRRSPEEDVVVPPALLLAVAYHETHLGCSRASGGNWGAPINRSHRGRAGGPSQAAHSLAWGYVVCGHDWRRATMFFRSGQCDFRGHLVGYTPRDALWLAGRVYFDAGVAPPDGIEAVPPRRLSARRVARPRRRAAALAGR